MGREYQKTGHFAHSGWRNRGINRPGCHAQASYSSRKQLRIICNRYNRPKDTTHAGHINNYGSRVIGAMPCTNIAAYIGCRIHPKIPFVNSECVSRSCSVTDQF
ncbi:MAG TPA: hypothetical protein DCG12_20390, partial [Planctomycetaceae bacterium]|nr:hypothetical protein [Planctomycetaceae bacterium]